MDPAAHGTAGDEVGDEVVKDAGADGADVHTGRGRTPVTGARHLTASRRAAPRTLAMAALWALTTIVLTGPGTAAAQQTDAPLGEVEQVLRDELDASGVPGGAVVVVDADGRIEARAHGSAGDSREVTTDTPFVIGSTTKSFTALAVMQLVDSGDVALGASVLDYVPELQLADAAAADRITVRRLLQHTSGLSDAAGGPVLASAAAGTPLDAVAEMHGAELIATPGDQWHYANINYVLAGLVVERASGMPYADYVRQRIFDPLGMTRSFTAAEAARDANLAGGHRFWFGLPVSSGPVHREGVLAAGYLISTAEDLGRYLAMYLNGGVAEDGTRIVSRAALTEMLTGGPQARLGPWADGQEVAYAMGWMVGGPWADGGLLHPGNSPDSSAMIALFPDRGLAMATLLGAGHELPVPGNPAATDRISRAVGHAVLGETVPESTSLRTFYLVFDLVVLVLLAAATWGLLKSVRALRRRTRPVRVRAAWFGVLTRLAVVALLLWALLVLYGWPQTWTWAPDLGVVFVLLSLLLLATAGIRVAGLVLVRR